MLPATERPLELAQVEGHGHVVGEEAVGGHVLEVEHHVERLARPLPDEGQGLPGRDHGRLAHRHAVVVGEHVVAELRQELVHAGTVLVEAQAPGAGRHEVVVGEPRHLAGEGDDVLAEAVDAHVEPEAQDVLDLGAHLWVVHVEVGLALGEDVQVPLVEGGLVLPCATLEEAVPVVGRRGHAVAVAAAVAPDVVVVVGVVPAGAALLEPRVLDRGVVDHEVHDHLEAAPVRAVEYLPEDVEVAVLGVDALVVGDVVAIVRLRRWVERAEPYAGHTQAGDVVEPLEHAPQVADAVAVAVLEAARPDLVEHRVLVPASAFHGPSCVVGGPFHIIPGHALRLSQPAAERWFSPGR